MASSSSGERRAGRRFGLLVCASQRLRSSDRSGVCWRHRHTLVDGGMASANAQAAALAAGSRTMRLHGREVGVGHSVDVSRLSDRELELSGAAARCWSLSRPESAE
jgi:hypothetical protein